MPTRGRSDIDSDPEIDVESQTMRGACRYTIVDDRRRRRRTWGKCRRKMRKTDDVDVENDTRDPRSGDDRVVILSISTPVGDRMMP